MGCSCYILGTLMEFMAMPAMLYYITFFLGFAYLSSALGVTSPQEERTERSGGGGKRVLSEMASSSAANQSPRPNIEVAPNYIPYPAALAKYEDVVITPKLFMDTLEKLHATMGTKFMIPIIGGKDLDLHRLFVEVTARGGIEKIVREKRWKEVTAVFNFPATATNASFVLRKYYLSLIYHYEQIYFFKAKGWSPCADPFQGLCSPPVPSRSLAEPVRPLPEIQAAAVQPPRVNAAEVPPTATSMPPTGSPIVGVIDGKFESGYLVTVKIGSEILKGVLYQTPQNQSCQVPQHHSISSDHNGSNTPTTSGVVRRRRRKKSEIKKRDPAHPKPNRSGYNFFFKEQHARLKPLHPGKDRDISRMIGELWTKMQETEKEAYQDKAMKDKERYKIEMADYKERLRTGQIISSAVPIQQRPPPVDIRMAETSEKIEMESGESPQSLENEISTSKSDSEDNTEDKDSDVEASFEVEGCAENKRIKYSVEDEGGFDVEKNVDMVGDGNLETLGDVIMEESEKEFVPSEEKGTVLCEGKNSLPGGNRDSVSREENVEAEKESVALEDKGATPWEGKEWFPCEKRDSVSSEENVETATEMEPSGKKGAMPHEGKELSPGEKRDSVPSVEYAETEIESVPSEEKGTMPHEGIESSPREKRDSLSSEENVETEIETGPSEDKGARPREGKESSPSGKRDSSEQNAETEKKLVPSEEKGAMPCEAKDSEMRVFIQ
ncbi:high mobility group B protein 15 isoform X2 [Rhododendron vialii]|uniref:high mobility group B protein 15 isoform X2 n=1 Tax=Rhododendron vialii TaxID=182163 RepID=UPI00265D716C|nr:high mobility group B protein 15 isoform X2 [Rhododendron vialii]